MVYFKTVIKTVIVIIGILMIIASFGALVVANEIEAEYQRTVRMRRLNRRDR